MIQLKHTFIAISALLLSACSETTENEINMPKVEFYSPNTVRIIKKPADGTFDKTSLVVKSQKPQVNVTTSDNQDFFIVASDSLIVKVSKKDGNVQFLRPDSSIILQEVDKPYFNPIQAFDDKGFTVEQKFLLDKNDALYGLGQHQEGFMNYRGKELLLSQSNVNAINPVLVSNKGYGIFWDNYSLTKFNNKDADTLSLWSEMGDNIDYYFFNADNIDGAISEYRNLTGKAQNLPLWAFGYWQSKERYQTQQEVVDVAKRYQKMNGVGLDVMVQDWEWWPSGQWSGMAFDNERYPNPKKMTQTLHDMDLHSMISVWPCVGVESPMYFDMLAKGYLYEPLGWGNFRYVDVYNPDAMKLYCEYLNKGVKSQNFDAWWFDSTEPDVMNALTKESHQYEMKRMKPNHLGSFTRYLNPYVLVMLDYINNDWRKNTPDKRTTILTRSAFAGLQRCGAMPWSGDIGASWEIYRRQIAAGLNLCMSGIPFWTFDIGSFLIGSYEGVFTYGAKDPAYQEFYTRMFQFGCFTPIFRSHGSDAPREMWEMPLYTNVLIKFDQLRYTLMPYIYSSAIRCAVDDYTMMRGLAMDFKNDENVLNINDQYMFGEEIMVCPVTDYMYHTPPQISSLVPPEVFKTNDGKPGINAKYYNDNQFQNLTRESIDSQVDAYWYTGRPEYVTDSMYSIRWEGKIVAPETGKYQFQIKSFDSRLIIFNGDTLKVQLAGNEPYYEFLNLEKGKEYPIVCETVNHQTGAARFRLFWKTPADFARETQKAKQKESRNVYLPKGSRWTELFSGKTYEGGNTYEIPCPIDIMPIFVKAGSILPTTPGITRAAQSKSKPLDILIYPGADCTYTLYEDAGDGYGYERGEYSKTLFQWNDSTSTLTIGNRVGSYPGMPSEREIRIVLVTGKWNDNKKVATSVKYDGHQKSFVIFPTEPRQSL